MTESAGPDRSTARSLTLFIILAYGIAWLFWLPMLLGADGFHIVHYAASIPIFVSVGTLGPMLAAFVATRYEFGRWSLPSPILPRHTFAGYASLLAGPLLVVAGFVLLPLFFCTTPSTRHIGWSIFAPLITFWPNLFGGPLEEEFGWRGFLLPRLTIRIGPTPAALIVGVIWSAWHLPLFIIRLWGDTSFLVFAASMMSAAVIISFAYNITGSSILAAILTHFAFNQTSQMVGRAFSGATLRPHRSPETVILCIFATTAAMLIVSTRGRLGAECPILSSLIAKGGDVRR